MSCRQFNINNKKIRYNWALQVKNFFVVIGEEEAWNNLTLNSLRENKKKILSKFEQLLFGKDAQRIQASSSLKIHPQLPLYKGPQPYLRSKINLSYLKVVSQIRLLNEFNSRIIIKGKSYKIPKDELCKCVERKPVSNLYHMFIVCDCLNDIRKQYIAEPCVENLGRETWIKLISVSDPTAIRRNFNFITEVLRTNF